MYRIICLAMDITWHQFISDSKMSGSLWKRPERPRPSSSAPYRSRTRWSWEWTTITANNNNLPCKNRGKSSNSGTGGRRESRNKGRTRSPDIRTSSPLSPRRNRRRSDELRGRTRPRIQTLLWPGHTFDRVCDQIPRVYSVNKPGRSTYQGEEETDGRGQGHHSQRKLDKTHCQMWSTRRLR